MKRIFLILSGVIILLFLVVFIVYKNNLEINEEIIEENNIVIENTEDDIEIKKEDNVNKIYVDIKGEVKTPGLYEVKVGTRVNDIIQLAGGLTSNADTSLINLAKIVEDEMTIIVYSKKEVLDKLKDEICVCNCPLINNDACIKKESINNNDKTIVNINTSNKDELLKIPGIGESKAEAIIKYRSEIGKFKNIDDIKNVTGIGDAVFIKIKDYIKV